MSHCATEHEANTPSGIVVSEARNGSGAVCEAPLSLAEGHFFTNFASDGPAGGVAEEA